MQALLWPSVISEVARDHGNVRGFSFFQLFWFAEVLENSELQDRPQNIHYRPHNDREQCVVYFTVICAGYGLLLKQCTFSAGVMYALWVSLDRPEDPFWWVYNIYSPHGLTLHAIYTVYIILTICTVHIVYKVYKDYTVYTALPTITVACSSSSVRLHRRRKFDDISSFVSKQRQN